MKYVYASRSGNVEELVHILGLEAMKIKDGTETNGSGLHSFYLYGWQRRCAACCDSVLKKRIILI